MTPQKLTSLPLMVALAFALACGVPPGTETPTPEPSHLKYFGFTLIDTYWDDPTDAEVKTNYADEVHSFSNMADILVVTPTDNIAQRLVDFSDLEMKAVLHLNEIFFELVDDDAPSGANYDLRPDYQIRWDTFAATSDLSLHQDKIQAFYIGEEPTWNGISFEAFSAATDYVKAQYPEVPILLVEAYPILDELVVPTSVDWLGFDHYFIKDPTTDVVFQAEWNVLKSKRSTEDQKLLVILDSHYISWAHGDFGGIELDEMEEVATHYHALALSDDSVIGILGYFWPNAFDFPDAIGARGLPDAVRAEYTRIGKEISGKE